MSFQPSWSCSFFPYGASSMHIPRRRRSRAVGSISPLIAASVLHLTEKRCSGMILVSLVARARSDWSRGGPLLCSSVPPTYPLCCTFLSFLSFGSPVVRCYAATHLQTYAAC